MGYWSEHPMGGDSPLDAISYAQQLYDKRIIESVDIDPDSCPCEWACWFPDDKVDYILHHIDKKELAEIKKEIGEDSKFIKSLIATFDTGGWESEYVFTLPFFLVKNEIRIKAKYLRKELKGMIADGGGSKRGYKDNEGSCKYAVVLEKYWDALMDGTLSFKNYFKNTKNFDAGLVSAISKHIVEEKFGLINKK